MRASSPAPSSGQVMSATSTSPRLHTVHFRRIVNHAHRTFAPGSSEPMARPVASIVRLALQLEVRCSALPTCLALHRFRTCLQDEDLAVAAVLAPLDVHRTLVVLFDDDGVFCQFDHVFVGDRETVALLVRDDRPRSSAARPCSPALQNSILISFEPIERRMIGYLPCASVGLVDVELVRVHGALHDGLAEAVARRDGRPRP